MGVAVQGTSVTVAGVAGGGHLVLSPAVLQ